MRERVLHAGATAGRQFVLDMPEVDERTDHYKGLMRRTFWAGT